MFPRSPAAGRSAGNPKRSGGPVAYDANLGYDADDMFGLRRAFAVLPPSCWERFVLEWCWLTEVAEFDVAALDAAVRRQARRGAGHDRGPDPLAVAWRIVAEATGRYAAWREARSPRVETIRLAAVGATSTALAS